MINPWDGVVLFPEPLVDLRVAWLSDLFTGFVSLPAGLSAPPTACRGRCGGRDVASCGPIGLDLNPDAAP